MLSADVTSPSEWTALYERALPMRDVERLIAAEHAADERWFELGWCEVCERASRFECDWLYSDRKVPNFRERLVCDGCGLNGRQRLVMRSAKERLAEMVAEPRRRAPAVYLYEQVTSLYRAAKEHFRDLDVVGSEYLGQDFEVGTYRGGVRHEDALGLSFESERFDLVISNDVYEHVPDIRLALREAWRVLRPGGTLLATFPFWFGRETQVRARISNGAIEYLSPPEFHGNPISEKGSLVFYVFGWDILEMCQSAGFSRVKFSCTHSNFNGYLGAELGLRLRADKPEGR